MVGSLQKEATDLIDRSRNGDQNATAMILEIRRCALAGVPKAQTTFALLKRIAEANPIVEDAPSALAAGDGDVMGAEGYAALDVLATRGPILGLRALLALPEAGGERGITGAAVLLANGPRPITKALVTDIGTSIDDPAFQRLFFYGVRFCGPDGVRLAEDIRAAGDAPLFVHAGRCVGLARCIQRVRLPGTPIGAFSRSAGWEHGE